MKWQSIAKARYHSIDILHVMGKIIAGDVGRKDSQSIFKPKQVMGVGRTATFIVIFLIKKMLRGLVCDDLDAPNSRVFESHRHTVSSNVPKIS